MKTYTFLGEVYRITDRPLHPFTVGVPYQRLAFRCLPEDCLPIIDEGDHIITGDHDLYAVYHVETWEDAERLMHASDGGSQARHQAARITSLVFEELLSQGILLDA